MCLRGAQVETVELGRDICPDDVVGLNAIVIADCTQLSSDTEDVLAAFRRGGGSVR